MTPRANGDHSALLQTGVPENVKKFKKFEKMYMLQNICVMVTTSRTLNCFIFDLAQFNYFNWILEFTIGVDLKLARMMALSPRSA